MWHDGLRNRLVQRFLYMASRLPVQGFNIKDTTVEKQEMAVDEISTPGSEC